MGNLCVCATENPMSAEELLPAFITRCCNYMLNRVNYTKTNEINFTISWDMIYDTEINIIIDGTIKEFLFTVGGRWSLGNVRPMSTEMPYSKYREILLQLDGQMISDSWYFTVNKKHDDKLDSDVAFTDDSFINIDPGFARWTHSYFQTKLPFTGCKLTYRPKSKEELIELQNVQT